MADKKVNSQSIAESLAKAMKGKQQKTNKNKKYGRARTKCARYRARVGKPRGRGVAGNKRGKNASPRG